LVSDSGSNSFNSNRMPLGSKTLALLTLLIGTQNYAESLNFYTKVMGFRAAFSFSPNGKTTNTYLQLSRDTFLELQEAPANTAPRPTTLRRRPPFGPSWAALGSTTKIPKMATTAITSLSSILHSILHGAFRGGLTKMETCCAG